MDEENNKAGYAVLEVEGKFEVHTPTGRRIMVCNDSSSAAHYAVLLNDAYRAGYRQALRDNR
jgi:hypothetical protein